MKDLDLSNAEGLDESITEDYSPFIAVGSGITLPYLKYMAKYKAGIKFTDTEKFDILRIESNLLGKIKAASLRASNGINAPSLITPEPAPTSEIKSAEVINDAAATLPSLAGANIKSVIKSIKSGGAIDISKNIRGLGKEEKAEPKAAEPKAEEPKEEAKDVSKSTEKSVEETETDKILGMPKMVAYGLGAVIVLVGGFFAYKKFKK